MTSPATWYFIVTVSLTHSWPAFWGHAKTLTAISSPMTYEQCQAEISAWRWDKNQVRCTRTFVSPNHR